ncbi:bile acid:sodium symporter family protein [Thalassotalea sp. PLHSN55]|uniref:bile acid:sodium symporter family protein n=1 Tax=Thalassotalea sp. PLHSN55 TaxID=3435888 RepID=UPI003F84E0E3
MQSIISQLALPLVLAFVMLGMGLGLKLDDFKKIYSAPKAAITGLILQLCFLPLMALLVIALFSLPPVAAAGLFLVSLCPGGATSNLFSYLAKGNVALSVSMTAIVSMLSPVLLPIIFVFYLTFSDFSAVENFSLPLLPAIAQLAAVTIVPTIIGMSIRAFLPKIALAILPYMKKISMLAMLFIIVALVINNPKILSAMLSIQALAVLALSSFSLMLAFLIAKHVKLNFTEQKTIAIEVGVQNAGTAMMVALSIMGQANLATVPLIYGLLMNIPAFTFVAWSLRKTASQVEARQ